MNKSGLVWKQWYEKLPKNVDKSHETYVLSQKNPHPRDQLIYFQDKPHPDDMDQKEHRYFVFNKRECSSASTVVKHFWNHFQDFEQAKKIATSKHFKEGKHAKYKPLSEKELASKWKEISKDALSPGSELYSQLLSLLNDAKDLEVHLEPDTWLSEGNPLCETLEVFLNIRFLLDKWKFDGNNASTLGTVLHSEIEVFLNENKLPQEITLEFKQFISFLTNEMASRKLKPYRTEWRIFDEPSEEKWSGFCIPGTIDAVFQSEEDPSYFEIWDWKRSKEIKKFNNFQKGKGCMEGVDDCNLEHYTMQLNLYKYILEKHYNIKIAKMFLGIFHPNRVYEGNYKIVPIQILTEKTKQMVHEWYSHLSSLKVSS